MLHCYPWYSDTLAVSEPCSPCLRPLHSSCNLVTTPLMIASSAFESSWRGSFSFSFTLFPSLWVYFSLLIGYPQKSWTWNWTPWKFSRYMVCIFWTVQNLPTLWWLTQCYCWLSSSALAGPEASKVFWWHVSEQQDGSSRINCGYILCCSTGHSCYTFSNSRILGFQFEVMLSKDVDNTYPHWLYTVHCKPWKVDGASL